MRQRAEAGLPIFHDLDNQQPVAQRQLPTPNYKHDTSWVEREARRELEATKANEASAA